MKPPCTLASIILIGTVSLSYGQNFNSGTFFSPELRVQHEKTGEVVALEVDNSLIGGNETSGNVTWTHGAGGYAGATVTPLVGVHLGAYTETTGNSLVFGRSLEIDGVAGLLETQLSSVVNAGVFSTWSSTAEVGGLNIQANQLYQVTFDVNSGADLPVTLLDSASFGISSAGVTSFGGDSSGLIDLLGVVTIGETADVGQVSLIFSSSTDRSDLEFQFDAESLVNLGLLGGVEGNSNVLTFSNIQVQAIPEPSSVTLSALFAGGLALRRRRGK
jgi:hypothetical protein